jgi:hypothetical protein
LREEGRHQAAGWTRRRGGKNRTIVDPPIDVTREKLALARMNVYFVPIRKSCGKKLGEEREM